MHDISVFLINERDLYSMNENPSKQETQVMNLRVEAKNG